MEKLVFRFMRLKLAKDSRVLVLTVLGQGFCHRYMLHDSPCNQTLLHGRLLHCMITNRGCHAYYLLP